ncbi:DUF7696 family protein [Thauera aromatica]|uniref:DUF7696 family protein n=1 Tax=Thauera aromatica TaxID=59405 RepID=UPI001FFCF1C5|nr:hypothetical protein [Thauera aromatica]MCK2097535.1 hypothetical protein [Thauera aromatica]
MLLPDIRRGPTWAPEHMRHCLARWIARQPQADRRAFFDTWERRRGRALAAALNAEAKTEFLAARKAA